MKHHQNLSTLAVALATALSVTACGGGGGGGNVKSNPPSTPTTPTTPSTCQDTSATNYGCALPCTYRYNGTADNLLVPANVDQAHAAGYTGKGVKVGLLDDAKYDYAPLTGQAITYTDYTGGAAASTTKADHGINMATVIVGKAMDSFKGGVAPDVELYWGRVCTTDGCRSDYTVTAMSDFVDAGVRIFNMSFGSNASDETIAKNTADFWSEIAEKAIKAGSLLIVSTGNEGKASAAYPAATPKYHPEVTSQWLAVTGVDLDTKGNPNGLAKFSDGTSANACGDAAQWCLAAPLPISLSVSDNGHGGILESGTSTATAEVSGIAALVSQAFPWMNGANLQTTLLTTATDLGDPGVDATYGWGLVNAGKAVKGPGQFVADFTADVTTANGGTFSNDISGAGGLTKTGAGLLTLSGANTYTGLTDVQGGALGLTGSLAGSVQVGDATFASYGGKIGGNYTAGTGSTTAVQIGTGLAVAGTANLAGTLQLLAPKSDYTVGSTEKVITAGTVAGTFDKTTYGSEFFWTASLTYGANDVTANLTRNSGTVSAQALSMAPVVVEGASHADALIGALDRQVQAGQTLAPVSAAAAGLLAAADAGTLASLSGQVFGTGRALAFLHADTEQRVLSDRLAQLGTESGIWFQTYGMDGTLKHDGYADARAHLFGGMAGVDTVVGAGLNVGAALGSSRNRGNIDGVQGSVDARSDTLAVYARGTASAAYLSGALAYGNLKSDYERRVAWGTGSETLGTSVEGSSLSARIEGGYRLGNGLTPYAAATWQRIKQDAFNEASASGLGFAAGSQSASTRLGEAGLRWTLAGNDYTLGADVAARHRFGELAPSFRASFDGLAGASFDVAGQPLSRNDVRAGLHGTYRVSRNASVFGDVAGQWDNANGHILTGTVGLRVGF